MKELLIMAKSLGGGGSEVALIELINALPEELYNITLVLLDSWPSYGAVTLGIDEIFIDTSRDQSVEGYLRSLKLAYKLAKLRK